MEFDSSVVELMQYIVIWVVGVVGALGVTCAPVPSDLSPANIRLHKIWLTLSALLQRSVWAITHDSYDGYGPFQPHSDSDVLI